jgi:hypothetical protein
VRCHATPVTYTVPCTVLSWPGLCRTTGATGRTHTYSSLPCGSWNCMLLLAFHEHATSGSRLGCIDRVHSEACDVYVTIHTLLPGRLRQSEGASGHLPVDFFGESLRSQGCGCRRGAQASRSPGYARRTSYGCRIVILSSQNSAWSSKCSTAVKASHRVIIYHTWAESKRRTAEFTIRRMKLPAVEGSVAECRLQK